MAHPGSLSLGDLFELLSGFVVPERVQDCEPSLEGRPNTRRTGYRKRDRCQLFDRFEVLMRFRLSGPQPLRAKSKSKG